MNIDMVQSADASLFPDVVGGHYTQQWRGQASSYYDGHVEFMDVRTYRVIPRSTSGRLGTPSLITVMGSRLHTPVTTRTISIGQTVPFSGRLTKALGVDQPEADPMSGPALPGRTVMMCQQPAANVVTADCNPVDSTKTSADGRFTLSATPAANSWYSVVLPSSPELPGKRSIAFFTGVTPQTDLQAPSPLAVRAAARTLTNTMSTSSTIITVRRGSVIRFSTSRTRRGSLGIARLQRLGGGRWHTIVTKQLGRGTDRLGLPFRQYTRGLHSFRVVKPADSRHVDGHSRIVKVRVS